MDWIVGNERPFMLNKEHGFDRILKWMKPFGELVLTLDVLYDHDKEFRDCALKIMSRCWNNIESGQTLVEALTIRPDLIILSTIYACFKRHGYKHSGLDNLIKYLSESPSAVAIERPRWRSLDLMHGLTKLGLWRMPNNPLVGTWIAARPEPWTVTDDIAYSITHNIFYATDFGRCVPLVEEDEASYLKTWLPIWSELFTRKENADLLAELIMSQVCMGFLKRNTLISLYEFQNADGSFTGPKDSGQQLMHESDSIFLKEFISNYHTTLVSAMAMGMCSSIEISDNL